MPYDSHRNHLNRQQVQSALKSLALDDRHEFHSELVWALQGHVPTELWKALCQAVHHGIVTNEWAQDRYEFD